MQRDIEQFDGQRPIEEAVTPPSSWYTSDEILAIEQRTVFRNSWQPVARTDQLATRGDFVSGDLAGDPYVVLRDGSGTLRAFHNVCRHHAACVANGAGNTDRLTCPYHGWTYDLEGRLRSAPKMGGVRDFDREQLGLRPIEVAERSPFVLINLQPASPAAATWKPLEGKLRSEGLVFTRRVSYEIACNWKVFVDNYLDGGYHVDQLHLGLASQLDLESYRTEIDGMVSIQSCHGGGTERIGDGALYAFVYPNFMINRYGPIMDTNWALPVGPDRCLTIFDYYFDSKAAQDVSFVEQSLEASDRVQQEDIAICESVQRGLRSSTYDTGRYAPKLEHGAYRFHQLLASDLSRG